MTIGSRIILGFGAVLALLAAVGIFSFSGIGNIVGNASEVIDGNRLSAYMTDKEVDHLEWAAEVNRLLTDDSVTELHAETDDHECALGKWFYGEGREKVEEQFPGLAPTIAKLEEPHKRLHASAIKIDEAFRQPHTGLTDRLTEIQFAIADWSLEVSRAIGEEADGIGRVQKVLPELVGRAIGAIEQIDAREDLTLAEKQDLALDVIAGMTDGADRYTWVQDLHPRMIMNPNVSDLNGKDLSTLVDTKGNRFFQEMSQKAAASGSGFVTYYLKRPGRTEASPKISYVELYRPWEWVIGTGTYLNEGNPNLLKRARDFAEGKRFSLGVELNEENCVLKKMCSSAFGREMQQEFPEFREFVGAIEPARLQMFSSAKKVEDLVEANRLDEAWTVYAQETMSAVNELQAKLNRIKELEGEYLEGFMEAGNIYANETTPALKQVQALLAQIRQDARDGIMTDEAMLGAATQTKAVTAVLALVAIVVGVGAAFLIVRGVSKVLKSISNEMDTGANQVASAASQVSSGAQSLAEGTSEQAASLEETSASLEELSSMSSRNDESSQEAQRVVQEAGTLMSGASKAMGSLNSSMSEIAEASEETRKIIKTIDEIAFQTNILALNAAVEAARAGEAGAGFAVVADEVRNLAQRAAQAAGDTADLIAKSVDRIGAGQQYVTETDEAFKKVQDSTEQVSQLISQIASASKEQLDGISQINSAVTDMDKVTQTSAAGAEESASAAEELSAQAEVMKGQVAQLIALVDKKRAAEATHGGDFRGSSGYRQPSPSYHHAKPGRNGSNHENGQSPNNRLNKQSEEPAVSSMGGDWE